LARRVELGELGDRRHLPQQALAVGAPLLDRARRPRQLRGPADLAFDLLDELADLGGGRIRLLMLDLDQRGLVLLVGEPDLEHAVAEQRHAHDREEQRHVFAEQWPADLAPAALLRDARADARGGISHSITSSAMVRRDCGTVSPSALAVLRLIDNSNFPGCWTVSSDGL